MNRPLCARRKSPLRIFLAAGLLAAVPAGAEKPDVGATLSAPAHLPTGGKGTVVVEMAIGSGWHVNSHTPSEKYLIPTTVILSPSAGTLSSIRYPKDLEKRFSFADKPLRVYEGTVRFEGDLQLPAGAAGEVSITGSLSYQACNDRQCFAPAKIPLEARLTVSAPGSDR